MIQDALFRANNWMEVEDKKKALQKGINKQNLRSPSLQRSSSLENTRDPKISECTPPTTTSGSNSKGKGSLTRRSKMKKIKGIKHV
jgi:stalled ribosome alternative rescue factor ArfA